MADIAARHPRVFQYNETISQTLPILSEDDVDDLAAVLKSLARGRPPRQASVPKALNAYNIPQVTAKTAWAYFHDPIIEVPSADVFDDVDDGGGANRPIIEIDNQVVNDLKKPWIDGKNDDHGVGSQNAALYRFICFIHKHYLRGASRRRTAMFTISIWDREKRQLQWHDWYPRGRDERQRDVQRFWEVAQLPGCGFTEPRERFMTQVRYKMVYHACENIEAVIRDVVSPQNTIWAVMSVGLYYMNHGHDDFHADIVPDRIEFFGGTKEELLPRMFFCLLWLYLRAPRAGSEGNWDDRRGGLDGDLGAKSDVEQLRIADKLGRFKTDVRRMLEAYRRDPHGAWLRNATWLYPALRIQHPPFT